MLREITVAGLRVLEEYIRPAMEAAPPPERLEQLTERYLAFALEKPHLFDLAFLVPDPNIENFSEELARPMWNTFRMAIDQVVGCMAGGAFEQDDPLSTSIMIWG